MKFIHLSIVRNLSILIIPLCLCSFEGVNPDWVDEYNITWTSQSENSSASMPLAGGNMGCNVWVEDNELLFYFGSPGAREENGALMKFGRMRISFHPDIFQDAEFEQKLNLADGAIYIQAKSKKYGTAKVKLWAEITDPVIHIDIDSDTELATNAAYESWRTEKMLLPADVGGHHQRSISWSNCPGFPDDMYIFPDGFSVENNRIVFYHRMDEEESFFPKIVKQQGLEAIKDQLWDPVTNLTFGGVLIGDDLEFVKETSGFYAQTDYKGWQYETQQPSKSLKIKLFTHISQTKTLDEWKTQLFDLVNRTVDDDMLWEKNLAWWEQFWDRSYIIINQGKGPDDIPWQVGRNYNIFRYMLVSGFFGIEPTMFNGGVLTFDPKYENRQKPIFESTDKTVTSFYSPDYRRWGGGFTAQNQRLAYWPMLKSGDFDGILPGFDFYKNTLATTQGKVRYFWGHDGCMCEEQTNVTGLVGMAEYGWTDDRVTNFRHRPDDAEPGISNNPFIGRLYDSQLEQAFMMLQYHTFSRKDISEYIPFIEASVIFYDEHFRMLEKKRTVKELDEKGKLVIYPTNALEHHPFAKNPTSVIAGMKRVLTGLLELPDSMESPQKKARWRKILATVPDYPISIDENGNQYFKPADNWERHHSSHNSEMYPLYPFELFGLGMPGLDLMENTLGTAPERYMQSGGSWSQSVIHAARLGMRAKAAELIVKKIGDGPFRCPAFFPGGDYAPDHNVGGSGMIGLQEMLMQTHNGQIHVLPGCPKDWNIEFKLHAPGKRIVEVGYQNGIIRKMNITPIVEDDNVVLYVP